MSLLGFRKIFSAASLRAWSNFVRVRVFLHLLLSSWLRTKISWLHRLIGVPTRLHLNPIQYHKCVKNISDWDRSWMHRILNFGRTNSDLDVDQWCDDDGDICMWKDTLNSTALLASIQASLLHRRMFLLSVPYNSFKGLLWIRSITVTCEASIPEPREFCMILSSAQHRDLDYFAVFWSWRWMVSESDILLDSMFSMSSARSEMWQSANKRSNAFCIFQDPELHLSSNAGQSKGNMLRCFFLTLAATVTYLAVLPIDGLTAHQDWVDIFLAIDCNQASQKKMESMSQRSQGLSCDDLRNWKYNQKEVWCLICFRCQLICWLDLLDLHPFRIGRGIQFVNHSSVFILLLLSGLSLVTRGRGSNCQTYTDEDARSTAVTFQSQLSPTSVRLSPLCVAKWLISKLLGLYPTFCCKRLWRLVRFKLSLKFIKPNCQSICLGGSKSSTMCQTANALSWSKAPLGGEGCGCGVDFHLSTFCPFCETHNGNNMPVHDCLVIITAGRWASRFWNLSSLSIQELMIRSQEKENISQPSVLHCLTIERSTQRGEIDHPDASSWCGIELSFGLLSVSLIVTKCRIGNVHQHLNNDVAAWTVDSPFRIFLKLNFARGHILVWVQVFRCASPVLIAFRSLMLDNFSSFRRHVFTRCHSDLAIFDQRVE